MEILKPDWWDQWTEYKPEEMRTVLKEDAPPKVRAEWEAQGEAEMEDSDLEAYT